MTGRYKAYPEYKYSGVEWVGDIPASWILLPLKRIFKIVNGSTPRSSEALFWDGDIVWITPADLSKVGVEISASSRNITNEGLNSCGTSLVPKGSLILSTRAPIGTIAIASKNICTNQGCKSLIPSNKVDSKFYYYVISVSSSKLNNLGKGTTFLELSTDELSSFAAPYPSMEEQQKIAAFLDHETAKIDTLIAKQEKLIELLKEKRQAVISHAVTKGLNPDAPMKDSGVEWLGQVPAHWSIVRLRFLCEITTGSRDTQDAKDDGEYPFFVRSDKIQSIDTYSFDGEGVMTSGDGAGVGKIFHHFIGKCEIHQRVYLFHKFRLITPRYFYHYLKQNLEPIALAQSAKSTVDSLRLPILQEFSMCFGNESEQNKICEYVDSLSEKYRVLIQSANKTIELMQERRTALISAAVTGKIDVRDFVVPPASQEEQA